MIEPIPVLGTRLLRDGSLGRRVSEWRSVDHKNIQTSVVVVVKQGHTWCHCFNQVFSRSVRGHILKTNSECGGRIDKLRGNFCRLFFRSNRLALGCNWKGRRNDHRQEKWELVGQVKSHVSHRCPWRERTHDIEGRRHLTLHIFLSIERQC